MRNFGENVYGYSENQAEMLLTQNKEDIAFET